MNQVKISTILKHKKLVIAAGVSTTFLVLLIILLNLFFPPVPCEHVETCDHFTFALQGTLTAYFCLNETIWYI